MVEPVETQPLDEALYDLPEVSAASAGFVRACSVRNLRKALLSLTLPLLTVAALLFAPQAAEAASGYSLTAPGDRTTTSSTAIRLTTTFTRNGRKVKKATALLQYRKGANWVTEKKVAIRSGKGSVKVKHAAGDRTYQFKVKGKDTSPRFTVHFVPTTFSITGSGFGHGVGMSQYGAYELARLGRSSSEILSHFYQGAIPSTANNPSGKIRVQVLGPPDDSRSTTTLTVSSGGFAVLDGAGTALATYRTPGKVTIGVSGTNVTAKVTLANGTVEQKVLPASSQLQLTWTTGVVSVSGAQGSYRYGRLIVSSLKQRPNVVNELVLNTEYLYGIDEMPSSWGTNAGKGQQALKAQVVAARTYALVRVIIGGVRPECNCHVFDDSRSQNFTGWKKTGGTANAPWRAAVDATVRANPAQINGSEVDVLRTPALGFAETVYFASSGSYAGGGITYSGTASNADAFGTTAIGYLSHVDDIDSVRAPGNPYGSWKSTLTQAKAAQLFGLGPLRSLQVTERYAGGLVKSLTATSVTGATTVTLRSELWRARLGLPGAWVSGITGR